jgi:hypothetical protein
MLMMILPSAFAVWKLRIQVLQLRIPIAIWSAVAPVWSTAAARTDSICITSLVLRPFLLHQGEGEGTLASLCTLLLRVFKTLGPIPVAGCESPLIYI